MVPSRWRDEQWVHCINKPVVNVYRDSIDDLVAIDSPELPTMLYKRASLLIAQPITLADDNKRSMIRPIRWRKKVFLLLNTFGIGADRLRKQSLEVLGD